MAETWTISVSYLVVNLFKWIIWRLNHRLKTPNTLHSQIRFIHVLKIHPVVTLRHIYIQTKYFTSATVTPPLNHKNLREIQCEISILIADSGTVQGSMVGPRGSATRRPIFMQFTDCEQPNQCCYWSENAMTCVMRYTSNKASELSGPTVHSLYCDSSNS